MTTSYILPLKAPNPLPANGVDVVTFKVWKNALIAYLQQDAHHHLFMPDGQYAAWRAAEQGRRLTTLHDDDAEKIILDAKNVTQQVYIAETARIVTLRNAQLSKFIAHIAMLCHHTENDDVTNSSTSLQWVFDYLQKHYGLETKGANFMNISNHVYKSGTPHQTFYKQYRASFIDNLRKRGDLMLYKNSQALTEDEKLSPSFENAIVLWSLEKIDPRLPAKVKKNYGHQMTGNTTLKDIQPIIFQNIPVMLEELEQTQLSRAFSSQVVVDDQASLNVMTSKFRSTGSMKPSFSSSKPSSRNNSRFRGSSNKTSGKQSSTGSKFCRICQLAGSDSRIFTSHEIGNCSRLTMRDLDSFRSSLVLNGVITAEEEIEEPKYSLQPGWDDEEAEQLSQGESE